MQKRRRFKVIVVNRRNGVEEQRIFLGYTANDPYDFYFKRGYDVRSVKPVARRKPAAGVARWAVNQAALRRACRELDIRWPVKITRTAHRQRAGRHKLRLATGAATPTHYITAGKLEGVGRASEILWHELAHAMQAERTAREKGALDGLAMLRAWGAHSRAMRFWDYDIRPTEVEARSYEQRAVSHPLTRSA